MSGKFSMDRQLLPSSSQMLSNLSFILFTQTRTFQDIIRSSRRWITRERTRFGWTGEKTYWKKSFDQREDWNFLPKVRSIPFYSTVLFPKKCFIEHSIRKRRLIFRKCSVMTQKGLYIYRFLYSNIFYILKNSNLSLIQDKFFLTAFRNVNFSSHKMKQNILIWNFLIYSLKNCELFQISACSTGRLKCSLRS